MVKMIYLRFEVGGNKSFRVFEKDNITIKIRSTIFAEKENFLENQVYALECNIITKGLYFPIKVYDLENFINEQIDFISLAKEGSLKVPG